MPDDDRHTRDRVRVLDPVYGKIRAPGHRARREGTDPRQVNLPLDTETRARRALGQITDALGRPDLDGAADRVRDLAHTLAEDGPDSLDLCAGYRGSGMRALVDQAVSVVLSSEDPRTLLESEPEDIAARVAEQFALGAIRRYALDRVGPFAAGDTPGVEDALDLLELTDLTFTSTILRALVDDLLN
ncbi:hypothetical protein ACIBFB_08310 [Nocardiopsis sp. NPDC050513]|uniref:hypothetical protein n=1 Tax=Nocardiopsis sp. NPDC050513 TaxID=3364338 RepID=UPI00379EEFE7